MNRNGIKQNVLLQILSSAENEEINQKKKLINYIGKVLIEKV